MKIDESQGERMVSNRPREEHPSEKRIWSGWVRQKRVCWQEHFHWSDKDETALETRLAREEVETLCIGNCFTCLDVALKGSREMGGTWGEKGLFFLINERY